MAKEFSKRNQGNKEKALKTVRKTKESKKVNVNDIPQNAENEEKKKLESKEFYNKRKSESQNKEKYQKMYVDMIKNHIDVNSLDVKNFEFIGTFIKKDFCSNTEREFGDNISKGQLVMTYSLNPRENIMGYSRVLCVSNDGRKCITDFRNLKKNLFTINR